MKNFEQNPFRVLVVDDNEGDQILAREAFADAAENCVVDAVSRGDEALERMLPEDGPSEDPGAPELPDLLILDINLPGTSGRDVLKKIRANPRLCHIPIVVMSGSRAAQDLVAAYGGFANSYVVKPFDLDELTEVAKSIVHYWSKTVALPSDADIASQLPFELQIV